MAGGESVRAFVPAALPPVPPLAFDGGLQRGLETALLALGRLDGFSAQLPDTSLFLYTYVRKEAVLSSQIEGTQFKEDRRRIEATGRRAGSALRVHEALKAHPLLSLPAICQRTDLSFPAASSAIDLLIELGVARELTGKRRNRFFLYDQYMETLREEG